MVAIKSFHRSESYYLLDKVPAFLYCVPSFIELFEIRDDSDGPPADEEAALQDIW